MQDKPLSTKEKRDLMGATNLSPADFPIGSPESRAVARRLVEQISKPPELTEEELRWGEIDKLCSEWVVSHKRGVMYWLASRWSVFGVSGGWKEQLGRDHRTGPEVNNES
jgi:hypothetical protein